MNTLIISLMLALGATDNTVPDCRPAPVVMRKKVLHKKKPVVPVVCPQPKVIEKEVVVRELLQPIMVTPPDPAEVEILSPAPTSVRVTSGQANFTWIERKTESNLRLMGHVAVGVGARVPHWSGLLGVRAHFPKVRLGAEVYGAFSYGVGLQAMVYPYQGEKLNWHVNLGLLGFGNRYVSAQDVPRPWDLTLGTGLEYRFHEHVSLAVDWRWAIPSPVFVAENGWPKFDGSTKILGADGRYLDVKQVFGNSFTQSHLMVGLLFY